jgi:regulator of nonsense transcripts 2
MRRKQSMQHFDQRQVLLLENAYYQVSCEIFLVPLPLTRLQCNPPERAPRQEKIRTPMELFIRHLIYDVLAKKSIDKVLKLIRKLDWESDEVQLTLHKVFTKPWKIKYSNISLLAMLTYDLQRYRPAFAIAVVDQVLEDVRRGLEQNVYSTNQRRVATIKYLGELYIYRLLSSGIIFDTLWSLVTFGHSRILMLYFNWMLTSLQLTPDLYRIKWCRSTCLMTFFAYALCVFYLTLVECASIVERKRKSSTIS